MRLIATAAAALALGCVTVPGSNVVATPSGPGIEPEPRPVTCKIDFYRTKPPDRAYDEIASLHVEGERRADLAQESLRVRACQLGAHAVVVTRDYAFGTMTGAAVVYRGLTATDAGRPDPVPAKPPKPPDPPRALACAKWKLLDARLRQAAAFRDGPDAGASFVNYLDADAEVCAAERATRGFRQVTLEDGRTGYVSEGAIEIVNRQPAPPAPAKQPVKEAPADKNTI
jgi:hypothetical protein